jgi:hypothetical protein
MQKKTKDMPLGQLMTRDLIDMAWALDYNIAMSTKAPGFGGTAGDLIDRMRNKLDAIQKAIKV